MEFFETIFKALNEHPTAALLVLALLALAFVWKDSRDDARRREAQQLALMEKHAEAIRAEHAAHLQTALQVAPLAQKLVTCIEILERLTSRAQS